MSSASIDQYVRDKYVTKQNFIYRQPRGTSILAAWQEVVQKRKEVAIYVDLVDQNGAKLWFVFTNKMDVLLELIESMSSQSASSVISHMTNWDEKVMDLLIDEAFHSSVIEGAISTRKRTSEMIKQNQAPKNLSERMIYNNYQAMMYILEQMEEPLTEERFIHLHHMITKDTLKPEDITEEYRDDDVQVTDVERNEAVYDAPPAADVQPMMNCLFAFIDADTPDIHPIIKACIIHFYILYVHPFFDGNGRTARAFTVLYLLKQGFHFFKYLSISTAIKSKKASYYKALLDCEEHPTDVTYFIENQFALMVDRMKELIKELQRNVGVSLLTDWLKMKGLVLGKRQVKQITTFSKQEKNLITIEEYRKKYKISYQTARSDLAELYALGIFDRLQQKNTYVYTFDFHTFCTKIAQEIRNN